MSRAAVQARLNLVMRRVVLDAVLRNDAIAMRHGLQIVDGQVLNLLTLEEKNWTPSEVAAATGLPPSTVTRVLDRLEQGGFVRRVRDDHDRRRVTLQPQPDKVQAMYADYTEVAEKADQLTDQFTSAELDTVVRYLEATLATRPSPPPDHGDQRRAR